MDCCENKNIACVNYENVCINCGTIFDYQYVNEIFFLKIIIYQIIYLQDFKFEGKRKDTSLVITRSFQNFIEHRH